MKVLLFGATGMIGQGVLRECLRDPEVESVISVGRSAAAIQNPKLRQIVHPNLFDYTAIEGDLTGLDACFFCLGVSSAGISEEDYERVTFGITLAAAAVLARLNPAMTFIYVSGAGTDSSERGRMMWARVKGRTENALLRLPFRAAYMFRPGAIQAMHGEQSRTPGYRIGYLVVGPFLGVLRRMFPHSVLTTEEIGRAMLLAARRGAPKKIMESADIAAYVRGAVAPSRD